MSSYPHKWKIEIPENIDIELACTGQTSGGGLTNRSANATLKLDFQLGELGKEPLRKGERFTGNVFVGLIDGGNGSKLWPIDNGNGNESLLITAKNEGKELEVIFKKETPVFVWPESLGIRSMTKSSDLTCRSKWVDSLLWGRNNVTLYQGGMKRGNLFGWVSKDVKPLNLSASLVACRPSEKDKKTASNFP